MEISNLPAILSAVLMIVAVAAAAWGALNRETLKTVRESNKDLSDRVDILERAETRNQSTIVRQDAEIEVLKTQATPVALIAIGVDVKALQGSLNEHHEAAAGWIKSLDQHVVQLIAAIKEAKP
ncbi:MAG: hypothetical protein ABIO67_00185 [Mycobacteriales bacterium]